VLPSTLGHEACENIGYGSLAEKEKKLRMGQANDALQGIRVALSSKAILFRGCEKRLQRPNGIDLGTRLKSTAGSAVTTFAFISMLVKHYFV